MTVRKRGPTNTEQRKYIVFVATYYTTNAAISTTTTTTYVGTTSHTHIYMYYYICVCVKIV